MKHMETLAKRFLTEEGFSLQNALAYAGMGMAKTTGQASEIIAGVGFGDVQYTPERQKRMAEILGEMLFHWQVLASTLDIMTPEEIEGEYINAYEVTRNLRAKEKVTIQDMMEMGRHVKQDAIEHLREVDNISKQKVRENLIKKQYEN